MVDIGSPLKPRRRSFGFGGLAVRRKRRGRGTPDRKGRVQVRDDGSDVAGHVNAFRRKVAKDDRRGLSVEVEQPAGNVEHNGYPNRDGCRRIRSQAGVEIHVGGPRDQREVCRIAHVVDAHELDYALVS